MATNVEVEKKKNENNISLLKRFSRRVQGAGILPKVRSLRYDKRTPSENVRKAKKLEALKRKENVEELIKLGKVSQLRSRRRRR